MGKFILIFFGIAFLGAVQVYSEIEAKVKRITYPEVRRDELVVDDYHGAKIADPYRWLENPDSEETRAFIKNQNNLTNSYINDNPVRKPIKKMLEEITNHEKVQCPTVVGRKYYYSKNTGLQNQPVYYVQDSLDGEARVFIDPNKFSEDGTTALHRTFFSKDGDLLAYAIQKSGSDWVTLHFKNVSSGQDLPDTLKYLKFVNVAWDKNSTGVYYRRFPEPSGLADGTGTDVVENPKIYYHAIGTNQSQDVLLVEFLENPRWTMDFSISEEKNYMIITAGIGFAEQLLYYANLDDYWNNGTAINGKKLHVIPVVTKFEASFWYITDENGVFYFETNKNSVRSKVIGIDLNNPEEKYWSTLIPEHETDILHDVSVVNSKYLVVNYIRDVKTILELRHLSNGSFIKTLTTNEIGDVHICRSGGRKGTELFYSFTSFLVPNRIYYINFTEGESFEPRIWKESIIKGFNADDYATTQIFYDSTDGTKIPMYIVHRKFLLMTGDLPTKLYGYGGYGASMLPEFKSDNVLFVQNFNGVYALANIRGGGEYGKKWWNEGRLLNKQQSFNDFQAAAEYLIANKYTNPSKLYIEGGTNGGLLVGACLNQRPELYGAAVVNNGILDMLRYQKFTIGYTWCIEFGCSEEKIHFDNLIKYSPLHNVRLPSNVSVQYPAVLVNTADHDDRAVPLHSYKFISELQYKIGSSNRQTNPLFIRIEAKAGRGRGKPISKQIDEAADKFSFLMKTLGYKFYY